MIPSILFHLGDSQHKESGERLLMLIEQRPFCFLHSNMYKKKQLFITRNVVERSFHF